MHSSYIRHIASVCVMLLMSLTVSGPVAFAQEKLTVSGVVSDREDGMPLPGVAVMLSSDPSVGAASDVDGLWSLSVPKGSTLVFSCFGYKDYSVTVTESGTLNVSLSMDTIMLDEVVAIGYGVMKKSDLTGSVASFKGESLQKTPASGLDQALQGVAAGVTVNSSSGQPGAAAEVRIRGIGTVNNSAPVYVVDGVIVDNINYISPSDIASTEILKDASATAIYGSRGANGVILVTTRKGSSDGTINVSFDAYAGIQSRWKTLELMNASEFAGTLTALSGSASQVQYLQDNGLNAWVRKYLIGASKWYPSNMDYSKIDTDWQDEVFRNALIQNYHLAVNGGNEKATYSLSGSWFDQEGTIIGSDYSRASFRVNTALKPATWLKIGENLSFMYGYGRNAMNNSSSPAASILSAAIAMAPWDPAHYPNGAQNNLGEDLSGRISAASNFKNVTNPFSMVEMSHPSDKTERLVGDVFVEANPIKGLTYRGDVSLDLTMYRHKSFKDAYQFSEFDKMSDNFLESNMSRYSTVIVENTLTYLKDFGKHSINLMAGQTSEEYNYYSIGGSGSNILVPDESNWYLSQTTKNNDRAGDSAARSRRFSLLGRAHYSYDSKYMLTLNFRADASSKFQENLWGYFPSLAAAWRIGKEDFLSDVSFLDDLKIRAGWGRIGNDKIGDNAFLLTMFNSGPTFVDYVFGPGDQALANGATILTYINNGGKWETTEQLNFGVDYSMFGDRFSGSVEAYKRDTHDMLLSVKAPASVGNRYDATANVGTVSNVGIELTADWKDNIGALGYNIGGNLSLVHNELTSLNGGEIVYGDRTICNEGLPLYTFWGYKYEGIYQSEEEINSHLWADGAAANYSVGDARYADLNSDGKIDDLDRTSLGKPFPTLTYALNFGLQWKQWDASIFFQGVGGVQIYNALRHRTEGTGNEATLSTSMRDVWSISNPGGSIPNPRNAVNFYDSSRFVEDGSYLRLKNLQIGYTLPESISQKAGISRLRCYMSCQNLLTLTSYSGYDPEVGGGVDYGNYPQARVVMFGVNVNFSGR